MFKGGASLSNVHGLIERFSEDSDLVLNWELLGYGKSRDDPWEQPSNTKQDKFNQEFNQRAAKYTRESLNPRVQRLLTSCPAVQAVVSTEEAQVIQIRYPAAFSLAALRPEVKLEIGPLASWVTSDRYEIRPYASEEFSHVFESPQCPVVAIKPERTFWEKATILHQQATVPVRCPHTTRATTTTCFNWRTAASSRQRLLTWSC